MNEAPTQPGGSLGLRLLRPRGWLRQQPAWFRYTFAGVFAVLVTAVRLSLEHYLAAESPFLLFYPAVFAAVLYLGLGPGLACLGLCAVSIAYFFVPARGWYALEEPVDVTDLALFLALAGLMCMLLDAQARARDRATAAQREVQAYAVQLEREVAERKRAEEALRQSNADLQDFAHIVSHDLKEPLRGITMTAKFALDDYGDRLPPEGRKKLETLVRLPTRLGAMLDALLDYSQAWRADLGVSETDLGQVVCEVVESLRPWLAEQHAEVVVAPKLPTVQCDRVRVAQVFSNLIANGVKYNRSQAKRVEVGAADGAIFVKDNGIGIDPGQTKYIFRMFRRLHAQDQFGGGTGSGLALVKKTVERHGGKVWVESKPGEGSAFCFTLGPAVPAKPNAVEQVSA